MADIFLVDTSILVEILNVPVKSDHHRQAQVKEQLKEHIIKGDHLFLPIATVLETGNHIAQNGDGNQRRQCAERFVKTVRRAVEESTPWVLAPLPDNNTLVSWLDDFPDSAMRERGIGDHSIVRAFEQACAQFPRMRVAVWTLDRKDLQGYDRRP